MCALCGRDSLHRGVVLVAKAYAFGFGFGKLRTKRCHSRFIAQVLIASGDQILFDPGRGPHRLCGLVFQPFDLSKQPTHHFRAGADLIADARFIPHDFELLPAKLVDRHFFAGSRVRQTRQRHFHALDCFDYTDSSLLGFLQLRGAGSVLGLITREFVGDP